LSDLSYPREHVTELLRLAIDTIPAMVWTLQPDGRVDYLNRGWLDYSGLSLEEALKDSMSTVHPDDHAPTIESWRRALARSEAYEAEMRLRRADGQYRWFLVRTVPALDTDGRIFRWYGTCIDIEDRKRAAEAVRENQQLLHTVLETLPVGVAVTDAVGDIVLNNAFSKKIWGGHPIRSAVERLPQTKGYWHDSGKRLAPQEWASVRALAEGRPVLGQLVDIKTYDGRQKTLQNSAAPIRDAKGAIMGAVVVNEDVTDRVNAEAALRETADRLQHLSRRLLTVQEEERRHLSRELHDEFGQLLSAISMHLHVAKSVSHEAAWPRLADCDALVQQAGERVRMLALELRPSMLDGAGLDGTLRWLAEQHTRQGRITVSVTGSVADVPNDFAITCFRIVQEALTNVVRHAYATTARIQLQHQYGWLRVAIEDDGIGFDVAATRVQAAASGHLGLTGMRERAEILGGHLDVMSDPQAGTRISVSLPLPAAT
jgi:PAS domain S-box-containing protein